MDAKEFVDFFNTFIYMPTYCLHVEQPVKLKWPWPGLVGIVVSYLCKNFEYNF